MTMTIDRRQFAKLAGLGGVVFASGLGTALTAGSSRAAATENDFYFVQMTDSHWGFEGPPNPEAKNTLKRAVAAVNALPSQPDFIMFTGDRMSPPMSKSSPRCQDAAIMVKISICSLERERALTAKAT